MNIILNFLLKVYKMKTYTNNYGYEISYDYYNYKKNKITKPNIYFVYCMPINYIFKNIYNCNE